jgi:ribosomal protein L11 methyltransferase
LIVWFEVSVGVARERVEVLEAVLEELGALAITLEDDADNPVLEPGPGSTPLWPSVHLRGLFDADVAREHITTTLQQEAGINRPDLMQWRQVDDQDWTRAWMARFQPMQFGRHLWIVPTGMQIPYNEHNTEIRLDPGLAFGTGTHPTTALCLQWLDGQEPTGKTVIDFGCGSGILGIAAALKGASTVVCVDNDHQALEATVANAVRNGVENRIVCQAPEEFSGQEADIVLANILAGPLIDLAPLLSASVKRGGQIVLSGVLEEQAAAVAQAYQEAFGEMHATSSDGWVRLDGTRNLPQR